MKTLNSPTHQQRVIYEPIKCYLLGKPEALETYPFDNKTAVFKVQDKMFALLSFREGEYQINLKCDPAEAIMLRDVFDAVKPGYHMNKVHWNTVVLDGSLPQGEIQRMIDLSYSLVVKGLKKSIRQGLEARYGSAVIYNLLEPK